MRLRSQLQGSWELPVSLLRMRIHQARASAFGANCRLDIHWTRAEQLNRNHTPKLGTRVLDVLQVACAPELQLTGAQSDGDRLGANSS